MDAQIFQLDEQRRQRSTAIAFPVPADLITATRSATEFFAWYAGAMLTIHVSFVRSAIAAMQNSFQIEASNHE